MSADNHSACELVGGHRPPLQRSRSYDAPRTYLLNQSMVRVQACFAAASL